MKQRAYRFDNLKAMLIFLVVFGHLLEVFTGKLCYNLYSIIYSFHMPAFLFVAGYFASFNPKKIIRHLIFPYLVFQIIYTLFQACVIENRALTSLQFSTPYWLLWYLFTIIIYYLLIPLVNTKSKKRAFVVFIFAVIISLLIGYEKTVGYYLSLSRTLVFLPFFLGGFYAKNVWFSHGKLNSAFSKPGLKLVVGGIAFVLFLIFINIALKIGVTAPMMYGSYNYAHLGYGPFHRLLTGIIAILFIISALFLLPDKKLFAVTTLGENTMSVYLLHGFIIKLLSKYTSVLTFIDFDNILWAFAIAVVILVILGNKFVSALFKKLF